MNRIAKASGADAESAKKQQQKLIRSLKHQIDMLSQFIVRTTNFYEGINTTLDPELKVLRGHLGGKANFALAENSISKLTGLMMQHSDLIKTETQKAMTMLEASVKKLQSKENISADVKQDILQLLPTLQSKSDSIFASLPYFEKAMSLYSRALENGSVEADEENKAALSSPSASLSDSTTAALHEQITFELRELINQIGNKRKGDKALKEVSKKLLKGINHQELLECCLVIIKAILKDVIDERKHAENFIGELHKSLIAANKSVDESKTQAEEQFKAKMESNQKLREHLGDIELAVEKASDLSWLKDEANQYLQKMAKSVDDREQIDQQEQKMLMALLTEMQSQLTQLENEAASYKSRLMEQKYRNQHDPLTQVPNRIAYNERIEKEYKRWKRNKEPLSLAVIDADHFKQINDNYGHAAGDKTLQVIAQHIEKGLRVSDFMARWGGEEFVVILPQSRADDLIQPLEKIRSKIEKLPFRFKNKNVTITVSIGATSFSEGDTIESAFERADSALYEAKHMGRNRCVIF